MSLDSLEQGSLVKSTGPQAAAEQETLNEPKDIRILIWPFLLCYNSHLLLLQFPHVPLAKTFSIGKFLTTKEGWAYHPIRPC